MYVKYKMVFVVIFIAVGLLTWLNLGYAVDSQPNPGMPTPPSRELPKIKTPVLPEKPDLLITTTGGGLGGLPDLYHDNPGMGPSQFRVGGQVFNGGRVAVRGCEVDVFLSKDNKVSPDDRVMGTIVITETIPPAVPGRYGSVLIPRREYSIIGVPAGTYFICTKVDPRNRIIETDESNNDNCDSNPIRIHPAGAK